MGHPRGAARVEAENAHALAQEIGLLVPVGIQLDPALLHQHGREAPARIEGEAGIIAGHGNSPFETRVR